MKSNECGWLATRKIGNLMTPVSHSQQKCSKRGNSFFASFGAKTSQKKQKTHSTKQQFSEISSVLRGSPYYFMIIHYHLVDFLGTSTFFQPSFQTPFPSQKSQLLICFLTPR